LFDTAVRPWGTRKKKIAALPVAGSSDKQTPIGWLIAGGDPGEARSNDARTVHGEGAAPASGCAVGQVLAGLAAYFGRCDRQRVFQGWVLGRWDPESAS
jgi:hypothetical protein